MQLTKFEVLFYYDGPDVVACFGDCIVIALLDTNTHKHIGVVVEDQELQNYVDGSLDLGILFANSSRIFVEVVLHKEPSDCEVKTISHSDLHEDQLPEIDSFYMIAHLDSGKIVSNKIAVILQEQNKAKFSNKLGDSFQFPTYRATTTPTLFSFNHGTGSVPSKPAIIADGRYSLAA